MTNRTIVIMEQLPAIDSYGNEIKGSTTLQVSFGVDEYTGKKIILPPVESPYELGATWDMSIQEWVIED